MKNKSCNTNIMSSLTIRVKPESIRMTFQRLHNQALKGSKNTFRSMRKLNLDMILYSLLLLACNNSIKVEETTKQLISTDLEFSALSVEKGKNHAFLSYLHKDGVILKSNSMPVKGKEAVVEMYENEPDSNYTLKWKPLHATSSESGDLGYTYGLWQYLTNDTILMGTYVTIWKKDENGKWKFILDSGNLGLGMNKQKEKEQF